MSWWNVSFHCLYEVCCREMLTNFVCPTRWHRSSACLSLCGLKSMSWKMTVLADVKLIPWPPERVVSKKMKTSGSLLNLSINFCLWWQNVQDAFQETIVPKKGEKDKFCTKWKGNQIVWTFYPSKCLGGKYFFSTFCPIKKMRLFF